MKPVVPGVAILDDAEHLSWLTSMESAGLDAAESLAWLTFLSWLTAMESAVLDYADLDAPESFTWLTFMESALVFLALVKITLVGAYMHIYC